MSKSRLMAITRSNIDNQISELQTLQNELKATPQFTSQDSGMLAYMIEAEEKDDFGDIVLFNTNSNPTATKLSHIPLPATPNESSYNSIYCTQEFIPNEDKPTLVKPLIELEIKTNGYHAKSEYVVRERYFGIEMIIYDSSNIQVGKLDINGTFNELFKDIYDPNSIYVYETRMMYTSSVPLELSYKFKCRTSQRGICRTAMTGVW